MKRANLFYQYYDALFQEKNYARETNLIFRLAKRYGLRDPKNVLEVGSGTGNHTIELAKRVNNLVAIDIDPSMVAAARAKIRQAGFNHVDLRHTSIEHLPKKKFNLVTALFNVVTYLPDNAHLKSFMNEVAGRLAPGGIFIFDCWNGVAAILDPPHSKTTRVSVRGTKIVCKLIPVTNFFNQTTMLTYHITATKNGKTKKDMFSFPQTLWTPMQIRSALKEANLEILACAPFMRPEKRATATDWKIMFVCRKSAKKRPARILKPQK